MNTILTLVSAPTEAHAITHNEVFHADDILATAMLLEYFSSAGLQELRLCRTRTIPEWFSGIVYDVGSGQFDHHQYKQNDMPCRENGVAYAAAGLIWRQYGAGAVLGRCYADTTAAQRSEIIRAVDRKLVQPVDQWDNGFKPADGFSFSEAITGFVPTWLESNPDSMDAAFIEAVEFARQILANSIKSAYATVIAKAEVEKALEYASSGRIMTLERFAPWQEHLLGNTAGDNIMYVIYPAASGGWSCQAVPDKIGGTGQRKPLPQKWRGLSAEKLREVAGVADAVFCHPAGFICGAESEAGAYALAEKALAW